MAAEGNLIQDNKGEPSFFAIFFVFILVFLLKMCVFACVAFDKDKETSER